MKFRIDPNRLAREIRAVVLCAAGRSLREFEDAGWITFKTESGQLTASANNGLIVATTVVAGCSDTSDGIATIQAEKVLEGLHSFRGSGSVICESKPLQFAIKKADEPDQIMTWPAHHTQIHTPEIITAKRTFKVRREALLDARSVIPEHTRVLPAREFNFWNLEGRPEALRMIGGDGRTFTVLEKPATEFSESDGLCSICIATRVTPDLLKILSVTQPDDIAIQQGLDQIILSSGSTTLILPDHPPLAWPSLDSILQRRSHVEFTTSFSDWSFPFRGVMATDNEDFRGQSPRRVHRTTLVLNPKRKILQLRGSGLNMDSLRTVPIKNLSITGDSSLRWTCRSAFLHRLLTHGQRTGRETLRFSFASDTAPVVVEFIQKEHGRLASERHRMVCRLIAHVL